jgi:hypothetical protein
MRRIIDLGKANRHGRQFAGRLPRGYAAMIFKAMHEVYRTKLPFLQALRTKQYIWPN